MDGDGRDTGLITVGGAALNLPPDLSFEAWQGVGLVLWERYRTVHWQVGDWLNYGEQHYGEMYAQALGPDGVGFDYGTLRNDKWVASRIPPSRRRDSLSFSHHVEVAPLPVAEQDRWLDRAEQEGLTRSELREAIRAEMVKDEGYLVMDARLEDSDADLLAHVCVAIGSVYVYTRRAGVEAMRSGIPSPKGLLVRPMDVPGLMRVDVPKAVLEAAGFRESDSPAETQTKGSYVVSQLVKGGMFPLPVDVESDPDRARLQVLGRDILIRLRMRVQVVVDWFGGYRNDQLKSVGYLHLNSNGKR